MYLAGECPDQVKCGFPLCSLSVTAHLSALILPFLHFPTLSLQEPHVICLSLLEASLGRMNEIYDLETGDKIIIRDCDSRNNLFVQL